MKTTKRIPTLEQLKHVRQLLATRLFGEGTIARQTGVPLCDVFRIARMTLHANDQPLPGSPKAVAERLRCLTGHA